MNTTKERLEEGQIRYFIKGGYNYEK
jgi:hypothetical protein